MKLILAILHDEDAQSVTDALNKGGYSVTKLCSTGGFLRSGNTTLLMGAEDDTVDFIIEIIERYSKKRIAQLHYPGHAGGVYIPSSTKIEVGGATIFITNVERFEKV
ncbi:MAG: cyclic-di-AMP receptor [Clostridia bacterium]|nr:cyclic-di-AMP receptor [Clostridia bacterium]